jgi:hypothetical protein
LDLNEKMGVRNNFCCEDCGYKGLGGFIRDADYFGFLGNFDIRKIRSNRNFRG